MSTQLSDLLTEAFPAWDQLVPDCWVRQAIAGDQADFSDAIAEVDRCQQRESLIRRLRAEHPSREHDEQHDERLRDVFTEAEALAWAATIAKLGCASFQFQEGAPDLRIHSDWWIEAKTIHPSKEEEDFVRAAIKRGGGFIMRGPEQLHPPHPGLQNKFDSALSDAMGKWGRQQSGELPGELIVFINLLGLDFGTSPAESVLPGVEDWAQKQEEETGARIVVCFNYCWQEPFCSSF